MKKSASKPAAATTPLPPVFPKTLHTVRTRAKASPASSTAPVRDNIFSKSKDVREDRGTRQMKNTEKVRTVPSAKQ